MASIRKEFLIEASPDDVWAAVRDVGAVHHRLVPGLVANVQLDGDGRIVTFANGKTFRELIVNIDNTNRRLVYAAVGGLCQHHNASMQVCGDGDLQSRFIWITDLLPDEVAGTVSALVDQGSAIIKRTLEDAARQRA